MYVTLLNIIEYVSLAYIFIIDIKRKIIPERGFLILLAMGFLKALYFNYLTEWYLGICAFSMPLLFLYIVEDYVKKELIGFGDIKLMMAVRGLLRYENISETVRFYIFLYILGGIFSIFLSAYLKIRKKKTEYIAFGPFIIMTYIVFGYLNII